MNNASLRSSTPPLGSLLPACGLLALTVAVFWPAASWLATQAFAREQLKQSFFIVLVAGAWIAWEKRSLLQVDLQLSNRTLLWFFLSYVLAVGAMLTKAPLPFLMGLVAALAGVINYVFGRQALRRTLPLLAVSALLVVCVLLFPVLDWPLRQMAGIEAARLLKALGLAPQLGIWFGDPPPKLILTAGRQSFVVATECNGFGLITSGLLLGLIRLFYHRATWRRFVLLLPLCVAVGFGFNLLRITSIVLLAPRFPGHYLALHETAGYLMLYAGMATVWWLTGRKPGVAAPRRPSP